MRQIRLGQQPSRVAEDVRAALVSLGRGGTVIGGVALIGAHPVGGDRAVEAVVVLPKGVLIVIGVDLPDPALRLEAPLGGPWKADGWPLVHGDDSVNPATEALDLSQECERRIAELAPGTGPVGTIIAVGPYVETVDQPPADLAGPVRVLYPTPTTMLAATVSLATARRPRSLDQARALITAFAPDAPALPDDVLLGEGFVRFSDDSPLPPESRASSVVSAGRPAGPAAATSTAASPAASSAPAAASSGAPSETPAVAAAPATVPMSHPDRSGPSKPAASPKIISVPPPPPVFPTIAPVPHVAPAAVPPPAGSASPGPAAGQPGRSAAPSSTTSGPAARTGGSAGSDASASGLADEPTESVASPGRPDPSTPDGVDGSTASTAGRTGTAADSEAVTEAMTPPPRSVRPAPVRTPGPSPVPQPPEKGPRLAATGTAPAAGAAPAPAPPSHGGSGKQSRTVRWLPFGAIGLLVVLLVTAVVIAATSGGDSAQPAASAASSQPAATGPPASGAPMSGAPVSSAPVTPSLSFDVRDGSGDQRCASHAFGDVQVSLQQTSCVGVQRASYAAEVNGRAAAVTVAVVAFPDAAQAAHFKDVADTPGSGGIIDIATETGKWQGPVPQFDGAAYTSKIEGNGVRLVQAVWLPGPSTSDDPGLVRAAKAALDLVLPS